MLNYKKTNSSLIISFINFNMIDKQQRKRKSVSLIHKIITILVCFHINWLGSFLLYEAVMEGFDIDTDGFMNMNGLVRYGYLDGDCCYPFGHIIIRQVIVRLPLSNHTSNATGVFIHTDYFADGVSFCN